MPGFASRAMQPIRNPVYAYNTTADFRRNTQPVNVLEQPPALPPGAADRRQTVQGDRPAGNWAPIVPFAGQTPYNVWALRPA